MIEDEYSEEDLIASWEAALTTDWRFEAYEKIDDEIYLGRTKNLNTHGEWEWCYFSKTMLEYADAYRTDTDDEPLYPDGGDLDSLAEVYETELQAIQDTQFNGGDTLK